MFKRKKKVRYQCCKCLRTFYEPESYDMLTGHVSYVMYASPCCCSKYIKV